MVGESPYPVRCKAPDAHDTNNATARRTEDSMIPTWNYRAAYGLWFTTLRSNFVHRVMQMNKRKGFHGVPEMN